MPKLIAIALAGAAGSLSRYWLGGWISHHLGPRFPFGTVGVNILGCFAIGLIGTLADEKFLISPTVRFPILIGFLAAFTTFSSFSYETWILVKDGEFLLGGLNVVGSLLGCFLGLALGVILGRLFG